jgi:hypothetical protein
VLNSCKSKKNIQILITLIYLERFYIGFIKTATEKQKNLIYFYCLFMLVTCAMILVALTTVVIYAEKSLNQDIIDLRINITIILKDIQDNCSRLLQKYPHLKQLPEILPTCWRVHEYYRYAKMILTVLILHDTVSVYLVSGGPVSYFLMTMIIGMLSIAAVYSTQMGIILLIDMIYIIFGFVIITKLHNQCFIPLPPLQLRTS